MENLGFKNIVSELVKRNAELQAACFVGKKGICSFFRSWIKNLIPTRLMDYTRMVTLLLIPEQEHIIKWTTCVLLTALMQVEFRE